MVPCATVASVHPSWVQMEENPRMTEAMRVSTTPLEAMTMPPPAGTSAVVATPEGFFDALVASQSTLDVYTLGRGGWSRTQMLSVPIQYGSSG